MQNQHTYLDWAFHPEDYEPVEGQDKNGNPVGHLRKIPGPEYIDNVPIARIGFEADGVGTVLTIFGKEAELLGPIGIVAGGVPALN